MDLSGATNNILTKYNSTSYFTKQEKYQFYIDFYKLEIKQNWNILNNNNAEFVDIWKNVEMKSFRKNFWFLENTSFIKNSDDLNIEVFKGVGGKKLKSADLDPNLSNSYTYPSVGVHHIEAIKSGKANIIGNKNFIKNTKYYNAKVEVFNENLQQWIKKKTNRGYSTFFPDDWTKQRVQEEMALAFANKKFSHLSSGVKIYKGKMSDGVNCIIYIKDGKITSMHPSFK